MQHQPWTSGPAEILQHGLDLLQTDSDKNRRLAFLSIDNAVELMLNTYLTLPKRITGLEIKKKDLDEFRRTFPGLLNAVEMYAADTLSGLDLGEIEWYHGKRNQLYHEGNGLTIERSKVQIYASLARILLKNLFGLDVEDEDRSVPHRN